MKSLTCLKEFRNRAYCILGNGRDGLFDLMDAVITTRSVPSFAELSLSPVFRRQWSSRPLVLGQSQVPTETRMKLTVRRALTSTRSQLSARASGRPYSTSEALVTHLEGENLRNVSSG